VKIEAVVGPQVLQDGNLSAVRAGRTGEVIATELHGKYYETAYRGNMFHAAMAATASITAVGTTSAFSLANPSGSGRNLVLHKIRVGLTTLPGTLVAGVFGLYANVVPQAAAVTGTAVVVVPGTLGSALTPVGKPLTVATLPVAPTLVMPLGGKISATLFGGISSAMLEEDLDGSVILTPGTTVSVMESTADTTSNFFGVIGASWEEVLP
jgi:hypothetical protein